MSTALTTITLWEHVFGPAPGVLALFSGSRPVPGSTDLEAPRSAYFGYPAEREGALRFVADEDGRGREVYFCAHLLTARRRVKDNAAPLHALYVDGDGAKPGPEVPAPTAVVESSPGRDQLYWRLSRPVPPSVGEALNRRLAHAMGGDRSGWDLTQLLRPPGTRNRKYPDAPPVVLRKASEGGSRDPDELDRLLPTLPAEEPCATRPNLPAGGFGPPGGASLKDDELVRRASAAANGVKFANLWAGDTSDYADGGNEGRSEADLALCSLLAFWTGPDGARIDGLFRRSGLYRPKWDQRRGARTYGEMTVERALSGCSEFWSEPTINVRVGKVYARRKGAVSVG